MNNNLKLLITAVCIAATAVCIVFTAHCYLRVREIDAQRMKISAASGVLAAGIRQSDSKATAEKKQLEERKKASLDITAFEKALEKIFSENPALQNERLAAFRAKIAISYGPFFQKMRLTPEQKKRLSDALVQRRADREDLDAILMAAGQTHDKADSAWQKINQESLDAFNNAVVAALGEDGPAQLEGYEQDMPMWNYMGQLATIAAQSGIPISLQQADQLVALMSSATSTPKSGTDGVRMPQTESDWAAIDEQAKTFLSKEQMDMFRGVEPPRAYGAGFSYEGRFNQQFYYEWLQASKDAGIDTAK